MFYIYKLVNVNFLFIILNLLIRVKIYIREKEHLLVKFNISRISLIDLQIDLIK